MMRRPIRDELGVALWTLRATVACRRQLASRELDAVSLPPSARLPAAGGAAVEAVVRRLRGTCLTRALVLQAWRADHGEPFDVVIGVTAPSAGFTAHAWLDHPGAEDGLGFQPLHRVPPRVAPGARWRSEPGLASGAGPSRTRR